MSATTGAITITAIRAAPIRHGQPAEGSKYCLKLLLLPGVSADAPPGSDLVVEANFIHQLASLFAIFRDLGKWQRIHYQLTNACDDGVKLQGLPNRICLIGIGVQILGLLCDQV